MHNIHHIPRHAQTLYSELLESTLVSAAAGFGLSSGAGSFVKQTIRGREYAYFQHYDVGGKQTRAYVGPWSTELANAIEKFKEERRHIESISRALIAAGGFALDRSTAALLDELAKTGCFLGGSVLVGTLAFAGYQNPLGLRWSEATRTDDIDFAADNAISVAVRKETTIAEKLALLRKKWEPLFKILAAESPPVSFQTSAGRIDLLTPLRGAQRNKPVRVAWLGVDAEPLRFLDFLIEDPIPAVLPTNRGGVFVYLPAPERYATHKLIVAGLRPSSSRDKRQKDLRQSAMLFEVLLDEDPARVKEGFRMAARRGKRWKALLDRGLAELPEEIRNRLR